MTVQQMIEVLSLEEKCIQCSLSGECNLACIDCEYDHDMIEIREALNGAVDYLTRVIEKMRL